MLEAGFMTYTTASHQGVIKMMSSIIISSCFPSGSRVSRYHVSEFYRFLRACLYEFIQTSPVCLLGAFHPFTVHAPHAAPLWAPLSQDYVTLSRSRQLHTPVTKLPPESHMNFTRWSFTVTLPTGCSARCTNQTGFVVIVLVIQLVLNHKTSGFSLRLVNPPSVPKTKQH